ncbi:hypothetical protein BN973_03384 [Mycobacterium triplex]|uniref:Uncharacterized protein n=1 Tax=Mycobacterium triplex TaxID=47839 RepID=A0A024K0I5_9MYCO|nr:hypothetical protein BN973_03384 [Mycobacterium triplex]
MSRTMMLSAARVSSTYNKPRLTLTSLLSTTIARGHLAVLTGMGSLRTAVMLS